MPPVSVILTVSGIIQQQLFRKDSSSPAFMKENKGGGVSNYLRIIFLSSLQNRYFFGISFLSLNKNTDNTRKISLNFIF
jgi:ABC-type Fe3+-siderophore transport system permease subunit